MNNSNPLSDNELVFSALNLFANKAVGEPPQWHEIADCHTGALSNQRSAEVLSHIANNPIYFQQQLDMFAAEEWLVEEDLPLSASKPVDVAASAEERESKSGFSSVLTTAGTWLQSLFQLPLPVYGGAFVAILLAILIAPLMQKPTIFTMQQRIDRSLDSYIAARPDALVGTPVPRVTRSLGGLLDEITPADIERHYFQEGLRESLQNLGNKPTNAWAQWADSQQTNPIECNKESIAAQCQRVADNFRTIGAWTMVAYSACQQTSSFKNDTFWNTQYELYDDLVRLPAMKESTLLKPAMTTDQVKSAEALCVTIDKLMVIGQ